MGAGNWTLRGQSSMIQRVPSPRKPARYREPQTRPAALEHARRIGGAGRFAASATTPSFPPGPRRRRGPHPGIRRRCGLAGLLGCPRRARSVADPPGSPRGRAAAGQKGLRLQRGRAQGDVSPDRDADGRRVAAGGGLLGGAARIGARALPGVGRGRARCERWRLRPHVVPHRGPVLHGDGDEPRHDPDMRSAPLPRDGRPRGQAGCRDRSHPGRGHLRRQCLARVRHHDRISEQPGGPHGRRCAQPTSLRASGRGGRGPDSHPAGRRGNTHHPGGRARCGARGRSGRASHAAGASDRLRHAVAGARPGGEPVRRCGRGRGPGPGV